MGKIKILFITTVFDRMGGAEKNLSDIACNIDERRFTPYVFCLKDSGLVNELSRKGINSGIIGLDKILSFDGIRKGIELYRFIKREKIQVVVTYHHDADIWGGVVAKLAGVPTIVSSRRDTGYQLQKKHIWAYRLLNRMYAGIVAVSDAVKEEIIKREWADPGKITVIYNGVRTEDYMRAQDREEIQAIRKSLNISVGTKVIGAVGGFRPVKGYVYLVEAIGLLAKRRSDFVAVIAGNKETDYYMEVQGLIKERGLEEYFICTGERKDIPVMLASFDIFVLPSLTEGFSNALIEAMAAGKPVVATRCGGNAEAVIDGRTGLLVNPGDSQALSTAIETFLEDRGLRGAAGAQARKRAVETFGFERMIKKNEDLWIRHDSAVSDGLMC